MKTVNLVEEVPSLYRVSLLERWSGKSQVLSFPPRQSQESGHCLQTSGLTAVSFSCGQRGITDIQSSAWVTALWHYLKKKKYCKKSFHSICLSPPSLLEIIWGSNISVIANTRRCILTTYVKDIKEGLRQREVIFSEVGNGKYNKRMWHYKVWVHRSLYKLCG